MSLPRLAVLALLSAVAFAPAADARHHNGHGDMPLTTMDTTGALDLGIDITQAGSTPENVSRFLASLAPEARRALIGACQERVRDPSWHQPSIVSFCRTVISL